MRVKKIAAECKARKLAVLWDVVDCDGAVRQWISTGAAVYPVDGLPYLQVDNLPALLSLTEKDREKMRIEAGEKPASFDLRDVSAGEAAAVDFSLTVQSGDYVLMPVQARGRTYLIDGATLMPIISEYKLATLYLRETEAGLKYFVAKNGLMVVGLVLPLYQQAELCRTLEQIGALYRGDEAPEDAPEDEADDELEGQEALT